MKNLLLTALALFCADAMAKPTIVYMKGGGNQENAEAIAMQQCLIYSATKSNDCKVVSTKAGKDRDNTAYVIKTWYTGDDTAPGFVSQFESESAFLYPCDTETANTRAVVECSRNCDYECKVVRQVVVNLKDGKAPLNINEFSWLSKSKLKSCYHVTKTACVKK
jgi:hypothetical protein